MKRVNATIFIYVLFWPRLIQNGQQKGDIMHKKVLAILLTASMVMSAPMAVMAGEADSTASGQEVESAAAAEDDAQTTESAAEETASAAEETASAAEETASAAEEAASAAEEAESVAEEAESVAEEAESVAEEAESAAEEVDFRELVKAYMTEIGEAVANVDLAEKIALTGDEFSEEGTVFTLFEDILTDIVERLNADGAENDSIIDQALEAISSLGEMDESELDGTVAEALQSILGNEEGEGSGLDLDISNAIVTFVVETAKANKMVANAVKETGAKLFESLTDISKQIQPVVNDDGTMDVVDDGSEESFEKFEAELEKVMDYIRKQDGNKHAALDILELLHNIVDEFHSTVHGHVHEDMEVNPASQRPETDPEIMLPVHEYELISSVEVNGRQGVCSEGDYYWVSGSTTLAKYDKDWKLIKTNDDPFKGYTLEVNHIADIDVYNNELYIGAEYFMDGVGKNIQIAVYDADTLELKRTFPFEAESGQLECSGIAVNPDTKTVWMCSWVGEESGRYLYKYDLETGKYLGKVHMQMPPQWLQGIAYYDGWFYMTADDGTADDNEPDHLYKTRIDDGATSCIVTLERTFDDVTRQGEIEGLTFDKELGQLLLLYNRGARIILGMPRGFYDGYDKEISEVFTYQIID